MPRDGHSEAQPNQGGAGAEANWLTNSFFFNWPKPARAQAPSLRPDVTVIFMGANDGFSVTGPNGHTVGCCSADWARTVGRR